MLTMSEGFYNAEWGNRLKFQAWAYSLTLHTLLIGLALLLGTRLTLAPQEDPFRWDVALVEPAPPTESVAPIPPSPVEPPPKAARPSKPTTAPAPQPKPIERRIETAAQPIVQQVETRRQEQVLERKPETVETPQQQRKQTAETHSSPKEMTPVVAPAPSLVERPTQVIADGPVPTEQAVEKSAVETVAAQPAREMVDRTEVSRQSAPVVDRPEPTVTEPAPAQVVEQSPPTPPVVQSQPTIARPLETPIVAPSSTHEENTVVAKAPPTSAPASRPDFTWLTDLLQRRSAEVRHYPSQARLNQWQGRVILRAVIRADGHLADVTVKKSSGHPVLDEAAMDVIRRITPVPLKYALGRQEVVVNIPISYELN